MNTISITGNLTESKGIKDTPNSRVAKRAIAENFSKFESQFTELEAWGATAAILEGFPKGAYVTIEGFLKHTSWKAEDGTNRRGLHVVVKTIVLVAKPGAAQGNAAA